MKFDFNIFSNIDNIDHDTPRFKKIIRNTLKEGIIDTFGIVVGDHGTLAFINSYQTETIRFGLIDLLLFPSISELFIRYSLPRNIEAGSGRVTARHGTTVLRNIIGYTLFFIGVLIQLSRLLTGVAITVSLLPIVLVFHLIKFPFIYFLQNRFYRLQGKIGLSNLDTLDDKMDNQVLNDYVKESAASLNELERTTDEKIIAYSELNKTAVQSSVGKAACLRTFFRIKKTGTDMDQLEAIEAGRTLGIL